MQKTTPPDLWQYRISDSPAQGAIAIDDMFLEVGDGLQVTHLTDMNGTSVGVLLGFPIDLKARRMIGGDWQVPARLDCDVDAFVYETLRLLGGRFLWIFQTQAVRRVYPDCSAQVPCVFDPAAKCLGSTAHALMEDAEYNARFDKALFDALGIDGEGWFPAGLTAHHGLHRLLPNHYLDLDTWTVQRFWSGPEATVEDPNRLVEDFVEIVRAQIEAMTGGSKRVAMALTAGRETRMLLACARPFLDRLDFVTVAGGDRHATDTVMSERIARDLGLSYHKLIRTEATPQQRDLFIRRGGHCNADSNARFHPSVWPISESHVMVGGVGGEVGRAFFWRNSDTPQTALTADTFELRFGMAKNKKMNDALAKWLEGLEGVESFRVLDLAYLENRNGSWSAVQFCCDPTLIRQAPLLTTRTVELMMQIPLEWKREDRFGQEVIKRLWPELEKYPYNSLGKWRDLMVKIHRAILNPELILKKIRKMRR